MIDGQPRYLHGGLLFWAGDILGSNFIAGFKEGVGVALRFCRDCLATRAESDLKVRKFII